MKVEYTPEKSEVYTKPQEFLVYDDKNDIGMMVVGDSLWFVEWSSASHQYVEYYRGLGHKLTPNIMATFMALYEKRKENES